MLGLGRIRAGLPKVAEPTVDAMSQYISFKLDARRTAVLSMNGAGCVSYQQ